jgi:hypothetical protein
MMGVGGGITPFPVLVLYDWNERKNCMLDPSVPLFDSHRIGSLSINFPRSPYTYLVGS